MRFQQQPQGEDLLDILHADGRDHVAPARDNLDVAFLAQAVQRFANRCLADAVALGKLALIDRLPRPELAGQDVPLECLIHLVGQEPAHGRPPPPPAYEWAFLTCTR